MTEPLGSDSRPLRVAVVGSGPSGFYVADALLSAEVQVHVDMFERLPVPFGLVRYGVAPDHQKIKNVVRVYEKTASHKRFSFFGNVSVGTDLKVQDLKRYYDAIVFTTGAETDKQLGIHGEDLKGSHTATEFVGWYNGHPDYRDRQFDLSRDKAFVIGQGNVAMDVCRVLCKTPDELKHTDIAPYALEALMKSKIREIHIVGRRGPAQAKFTPPEIREFGELADCDPVVHPDDLKLNPESQKELDDPANAASRKNYEILRDFATQPAGKKHKKFIMHFLASPMELRGDGHVESVILEKNVLTGEPGRQRARLTGETMEIDCGLFFRSVGYRGVAIANVPFDHAKGIIPNDKGRVLDLKTGSPVSGFYCAGWIKRGPSGVIGTNKPDSVETARNILADIGSLAPCPEPDSGTLLEHLRKNNIKPVLFEDWKKIDAEEIRRGKELGKPREKFILLKDIRAFLG